MRRSPLLLLALGLTATPLTSPAGAAPSLPTGSCVATRGASTCGLVGIRCTPVVGLVVTVVGHGSGFAQCGSASASCATGATLTCTDIGGGGGAGALLSCWVTSTLDVVAPVAVCTAVLSD